MYDVDLTENFKMRLNYAIIFVSDMQRSVAFYRDVLGLTLKLETPEWTEFPTEGATLALHSAKETSGIKKVPESSSPGQSRPGLLTEDLDKFHSRVIERGATCVQKPREIFGSRVAQYLDPDGLVVSVSETRNGI